MKFVQQITFLDMEAKNLFFTAKTNIKEAETVLNRLLDFFVKKVFTTVYLPLMNKIIDQQQNASQPASVTFNENMEIYEDADRKVAGKVGKDYLQVYQNGKWKDLLIKGVNMGISKPGHFPGETAISKEEYLRWFKEIGKMNANSIRVYTIHPPGFYEALAEYNQKPKNPFIFSWSMGE